MQSRQWLRSVGLGVLAVTLAFGACDRQDGGTVRGILEPQFQANGTVQARPEKVRENSGRAHAAREAGRMIGRDGGVIEFRDHRLVVPAGAVDGPTLFRIAQVQDGVIEVELKALQVKAGGKQTDRGAAGFARPITLELSYSAAENVADAGKLAIGWVRDDGTIQVLPSTVDRGTRMVRAQLNHFSKYAMVAN